MYAANTAARGPVIRVEPNPDGTPHLQRTTRTDQRGNDDIDRLLAPSHPLSIPPPRPKAINPRAEPAHPTMSKAINEPSLGRQRVDP
jgi:hypothetical protein